MTVTLIAAHSENRVLSAGGRLPWHLPDEVRHFRTNCAEKWIIAGRRTWSQMDGWFQPDQTPVVITRDPSLKIPNGYSAPTVEHALALAKARGAEECVVIGGARVFTAALPHADRLILTVVHAILPGDVFFPALPPDTWREVNHHYHPADAAHAYAFTIRWLARAHP